MSKTSIGIEIEVNQLRDKLYESTDWKIWSNVAEHCGNEIRTRAPCVGHRQIRSMISSLKNMEKNGEPNNAGFDNAGTHIHIDFLRDSLEYKPLVKKQAPSFGENRKAFVTRFKKRYGTIPYNNPLGNYKKYYFIDDSGKLWATTADWRNANGITKSPSAMSNKTHPRILLNVQRFLALGIRFADVLFCIQHPDRRFNKYCHSISGWNEDTLFSTSSVDEIIKHKNLAQNHRRLMFNPLAFQKHGTIEVRMLKASLNTREIWAQIQLFGKMARKAKQHNVGLPQATGNIALDFFVLLDFCGIHGKTRRILTEMLRTSMSTKEFYCYCFLCYGRVKQELCTDIGLSRAVCEDCNARTWCPSCGTSVLKRNANQSQYVDELIVGGRWLCGRCSKDKTTVKQIKSAEEQGGYISSLGVRVGSGFDHNGIKELRRMRDIFS